MSDSLDVFGRSAYDAAEKQAKSREARKNSKVSGPMRFWIPAGLSKRVIFLDDNPPELVEHQVTIDGDWRHWFLCLRTPDANGFWTVGNCPFCDMKIPKYLMGPYSVVDETGYTDKKTGEEKKNIKHVLVAKERSLNKFKRLSARHGGLSGNRFECFRTDGKSVVIGDDWAFTGKVEEAVWSAIDNKPVNYRDYFKKVTVEEAKAILASGTITIPEKTPFNDKPEAPPKAAKPEDANVSYE